MKFVRLTVQYREMVKFGHHWRTLGGTPLNSCSAHLQQEEDREAGISSLCTAVHFMNRQDDEKVKCSDVLLFCSYPPSYSLHLVVKEQPLNLRCVS